MSKQYIFPDGEILKAKEEVMDYENFDNRYYSFNRAVPEMDHEKKFDWAVAGFFYGGSNSAICPFCNLTLTLNSNEKLEVWIGNRYIITTDTAFYKHLKYSTRKCKYLANFYPFLRNDWKPMTT